MSICNFLEEGFGQDMAPHYPVRISCSFCNDKQEIHDVGDWVSIVRELKNSGENNYGFRRCLAECHKILIEGKTDCPSCRRSK
jgi:hypothetical protein